MKEFDELISLVETLRSDRGCPWDRALTMQEFKTFLLEETYELIEAIERKDGESIKEEIGDVLLHMVFLSQIAKEQGLFDVKEVLHGVCEKMYRRHPHVFGGRRVESIEKEWEATKRRERPQSSILGPIPKALPALLKAYLVSRKVERVGFDWKDREEIYGKFLEELEELKEAERSNEREAVREEIGDLLFTVVQICRSLKIDPEDALRFTVEKFIRRFNALEERTKVGEATQAEMNEIWERIKEEEKGV
jgi:MazG family protein